MDFKMDYEDKNYLKFNDQFFSKDDLHSIIFAAAAKIAILCGSFKNN
jgi:hypothetical protein